MDTPERNIFDILGHQATDKVTGFSGVISSLSFDLYGCIQAVLSPPVDKEAKKQDCHWFDTNRLVITSKERVMDPPDFTEVPILAWPKGPAEKPPR